MKIKQLKKPINIKMEQYECESCKKKIYINQEDKVSESFSCPFCHGESKNIRIFSIQINGIGEYLNG